MSAMLTPTLGNASGYTPKPGARHDCGDGVWRTVSEIAAETGCTWSAIHARIAKGWTGKDLLRQRCRRLYDCGGEVLSVQQIAARAGVSESSIHTRLARGVRGKGLLVKAGCRRDQAGPRSPTMVLACRLADAFPDELPTTAEIRRMQPMSAQTAERWRTALRAAREAA